MIIPVPLPYRFPPQAVLVGGCEGHVWSGSANYFIGSGEGYIELDSQCPGTQKHPVARPEHKKN